MFARDDKSCRLFDKVELGCLGSICLYSEGLEANLCLEGLEVRLLVSIDSKLGTFFGFLVKFHPWGHGYWDFFRHSLREGFPV